MPKGIIWTVGHWNPRLFILRNARLPATGVRGQHAQNLSLSSPFEYSNIFSFFFLFSICGRCIDTLVHTHTHSDTNAKRCTGNSWNFGVAPFSGGVSTIHRPAVVAVKTVDSLPPQPIMPCWPGHLTGTPYWMTGNLSFFPFLTFLSGH